MAELFLVVGLPGAGKTTRARALAAERDAVRLTPDEWMGPLFGDSDADGMRDVVEGRLVWTAAQVLAAGASVVLDFGFWGRDERCALAWLGRSLGAGVRTVYLPVDPETQWKRVAARWRDTPEQTWPITRADLDEWRGLFQEPDAAEVSGRYADAPADGGTWDTWTAARWPTSRTPR